MNVSVDNRAPTRRSVSSGVKIDLMANSAHIGSFCAPLPGWMQSDAEDADAPGGVLDHGQDIGLGAIEQVGGEEVARRDRLGLGVRQLRPGRRSPPRRRICPARTRCRSRPVRSPHQAGGVRPGGWSTRRSRARLSERSAGPASGGSRAHKAGDLMPVHVVRVDLGHRPGMPRLVRRVTRQAWASLFSRSMAFWPAAIGVGCRVHPSGRIWSRPRRFPVRQAQRRRQPGAGTSSG